nr:hypothetical protein [Plasmopara viticola lesion associated mononegaambi virus 6]
MSRSTQQVEPKKASNYSQNVVEGIFDEAAEEAMSEDLRSQGKALPTIEELNKFAQKAEKGITKDDVKKFQEAKERKEWSEETDTEEGIETDDDDERHNQGDTAGDDDIEKMVEDASTPIQTTFKQESRKASRPSFHTKDRKPSTTDNETYQESFTSQQESAEMRHQIESLDTRLMNMETMFEALLEERKGLPKHLEGYREEMNKQLTVMMDRIHTALEKDIPSTSLEQAKGDIERMTGETEHVFDQLKTDVENNPSTGSATASAAPITKSRRRVRLIK